MKQFLLRIGATEELTNLLKNGNFAAHVEKETGKIRVTFTDVTHLNSKNYLELFTKIKLTVANDMNAELSFVKFEIEAKNEILHIYENIREFINWIDPKFNLSHLYISFDESNNLVFFVANKNARMQLEKIMIDLRDYLHNFSITDKNIILRLDESVFAIHKLNELLVNSDSEIVESYNSSKQVVLDETVREGYDIINFEDPSEKQMRVYYQGKVINYEKKTASTGTEYFDFELVSGLAAVKVTLFNKNQFQFSLNNGDSIRVYGNYEYNEYQKTHVLRSFNVKTDVQVISNETLSFIEEDNTEHRRNEFHVHTKMSTLDGVADVSDYIKYAKAYKIDSITITDHNTVQSYPDAYAAAKKSGLKINYGVELDIYDDLNTEIVINERDQELLDAEYVFFDLETTSVSAWLSEIIEFGAVKFKNNTIIDRKQMFIKPNREVSEFTTSLTSITNDDVKNAPSIEEAIVEIKNWIGDAILVAHNASFDHGFLNKAYVDAGFGPIKNPVVDSMKLSWFFHPNSRSHRLGILAKNEMITYDEEAAHRADYDAEVLARIFERLLQHLLRSDFRNLKQLNGLMSGLNENIFTNHITVISKNQEGLRDINEIVSKANVEFFNKKKKSAMMPLSFFINKEQPLLKNMLVGSSCSKGILFEAILNANWAVAESVVQMYDYLEIFPPTAYKHLINNHIIDWNELKQVLRKIKELGDKYNIPVIISSNAHYAAKEEKEYRNILITAKRVGGGSHPLHNYRNPKVEKPDNHLRSTTEIFKEFNGWFDEDVILEMAITNPAKLQSMITEQKPVKDKLYPPSIPNATENLKESVYANLKELYGDNPDKRILDRIDRELNPIIEHGFSIVYYLSAIAVKKSNDDGYLVGSRGSVGSSIVATLAGITEVNPLEPHYRCPKCKHHEFNDSVADGYDLETKVCPICGEKMIGDGHNIPFETFLGFNADKVPDIDLNFSRDNQSDIHLYMKEVLGEDSVFRAGTISTAAPKTAIGYVKNYGEIVGKEFNKSTTEWLASKIEGAKRTTGQHPGGLIVIPSDMSVYDFTPVNYPGDDADSDWKTTHFDFHSIHDNVLKLDLLGHLDPSTVRMLENLTGVKPTDIPMNDKEVISLFESTKSLHYTEDYTGEDLGILGMPEFGTKFVRELVREAKPKSFADLVRISGLSHGTDVWSNNAQKLIKEEKATLAEVISVRDDIMTYLISMGLENKLSFDIMESVRKGKGLTPEWEQEMIKNNVPDWYIESCKTIKYMFPKAHATAYVMMAFRISWYKINYPLEYYAAYFSKRDVEISIDKVLLGIDEMKKHYAELKAIPYIEKLKKHDDLIETYNIIFEMYSRGYEFENVNIHLSRSENYEINRETGKIVPPFSVLDGVGSLVAKAATNERKRKPYESAADFKNRCGLPNKVIAALEELGVFAKGEGEKSTTQQLSLFE